MLKTALALLTLASSASAAMASSSSAYNRSDRTRFDERTNIERRIVRDRDAFDRSERPDLRWTRPAADDFGPRHYRSTWVPLSSIQLARGGRDVIDVTDRGTFTQLRLQSEGGIARVEQVLVQFADGSTQLASPWRTLDARGELLEIPLDGNNRRIARITVTGSAARGAVQLFAI